MKHIYLLKSKPIAIAVVYLNGMYNVSEVSMYNTFFFAWYAYDYREVEIA